LPDLFYLSPLKVQVSLRFHLPGTDHHLFPLRRHKVRRHPALSHVQGDHRPSRIARSQEEQPHELTGPIRAHDQRSHFVQPRRLATVRQRGGPVFHHTFRPVHSQVEEDTKPPWSGGCRPNHGCPASQRRVALGSMGPSSQAHDLPGWQVGKGPQMATVASSSSSRRTLATRSMPLGPNADWASTRKRRA
jgi:hypothetical protein